MSVRCLRTACLSIILAVVAASPAAGQEATGTATFRVFLRGSPVGTEEATVRSTPEGWEISGKGRLGAPLNLTTRQLTLRYTREWHPISLHIDAVTGGTALLLETTFADGLASSEITRAGATTRKQDQIAPSAIVLPNLFFSSYEALALQLASIPVGSQVRTYIAPQAEVVMKHTARSSRKVETASRVIDVRTHSVTFMNPGGPLEAIIWTDEAGRLLKFEVAAQQLSVLREDVASVSARALAVTRAGDQSVRIQGNGFVLAATLSQPGGSPPADREGRFPAIVLVGGSGPTDRDETVAGIPIFGQLAGALADAGFYVLRYDKRGVGQSGGRLDGASLGDFADDALAAVEFLKDREDVDDDRIALFGHSEGAWVALVAGSRENDLAALILAAAPASTGGELVLEQQRYLLSKMELSPEDAQARMQLQRRIQAAVLGTGSWEGIPEALRRQADTAWFRSFLAFSPGDVMEDVEQPILILQGEIDRQVPANHADRLEELAKQEGDMPAELVEMEVIDGANHLMVQAETGDLSEYSQLKGSSIDPRVAEATVEWLRRVFAAKD